MDKVVCQRGDAGSRCIDLQILDSMSLFGMQYVHVLRVGFCLPKAGLAAEAGKLIRCDIVEGYRGAGWEVPEKTEPIFQMCYSSDEGYSWEEPEALVVQYPI